jgi:alpha-methylacyl-CoA racemase
MTGMMLADMGAAVVRIEREVLSAPFLQTDISQRGKRSITLDLKRPAGVETLLRLVDRADALIEGYRPGVMERLGVGPDVCMRRNPKLIYGRVTGWGQEGPLAKAAGHDINYIALTGVLHAIGGRNGKPLPPLNLVGDMGAGGMLLAYGVVCAMLEAQRSGTGQIVDAAMVDGIAQLMWMIHSLHADGAWSAAQRASNRLDGGAHFYCTYETADGKYIAIGAIEPQFYAKLLELIGADPRQFAGGGGQLHWRRLKAKLGEIFRLKTRDEWCRILEGTDACFAPVLTIEEAPLHSHNRARGTYLKSEGVTQPAPAPRFSRTSAERSSGPRSKSIGADAEEILIEAGFNQDEIRALQQQRAVIQPDR